MNFISVLEDVFALIPYLVGDFSERRGTKGKGRRVGRGRGREGEKGGEREEIWRANTHYTSDSFYQPARQVHLVPHPLCHGNGRDSPRLCDTDHALFPRLRPQQSQPRLVEKLRDLSGLSTAGFAADNDHGILPNSLNDDVFPRKESEERDETTGNNKREKGK